MGNPSLRLSEVLSNKRESFQSDDLKKEDSLDILIQFLDKHLEKDDLTDSIEKFEEFDDCQIF